jgi:deoxyribodipyrimidine photolyase-related protein
LQPANELAQSLGQELGRAQVLLRRLPARQSACAEREPTRSTSRCPLRHLVLGDQLDADAAAIDGFDPAQDAAWVAEVREEPTHIPSSQMRTAFFLCAMRAAITFR